MNSRRNFLRLTGLIAATSLLLPNNVLANVTVANQKTKLKPSALKPGDTIAISSPAGAVWDPAQVETFSTILKGFGFNVVLGKTLSEKFGYFAGTDELRATELNTFFADPNIKGIFCMKGGWGCARLLDKLDFKLIEKNPKVLIGFSDITTLLIAITAKTGLVTFHGPVGNSGWNAWTSNVFKNVIMNSAIAPAFANPNAEDTTVTITSGTVSGELIGGNLTVIASLMGTMYLPDWKGKILFLEEVKEEPYSIDRMLTQLKLCGVLDVIGGFVFGKCAKCLAEEPQKAFTFHEVILQHIKPLGIPAFYGAMIGHIENKLTVPLGIKATLNADKGIISLEEGSVV
ncbi:MAG: LD-carboxypeptidase [Bacteroidota bacterium]